MSQRRPVCGVAVPAKDGAANRGDQRTSNPLNATSNVRDKSLLAGSFRRRVQIQRISSRLAVAAKWSASSEANRSMVSACSTL